MVADGPERDRRASCALCIREGVDNIKLNISGDDFVPAKGGMTVMREEEVRMAVRGGARLRPARERRTRARATRSSARCPAAST